MYLCTGTNRKCISLWRTKDPIILNSKEFKYLKKFTFLTLYKQNVRNLETSPIPVKYNRLIVQYLNILYIIPYGSSLMKNKEIYRNRLNLDFCEMKDVHQLPCIHRRLIIIKELIKNIVPLSSFCLEVSFSWRPSLLTEMEYEGWPPFLLFISEAGSELDEDGPSTRPEADWMEIPT